MDCNCGAHWMQDCSWWCGLTNEEYEKADRKRNPSKYVLKEVEELRKEVKDLKNLILKDKELIRD